MKVFGSIVIGTIAGIFVLIGAARAIHQVAFNTHALFLGWLPLMIIALLALILLLAGMISWDYMRINSYLPYMVAVILGLIFVFLPQQGGLTIIKDVLVILPGIVVSGYFGFVLYNGLENLDTKFSIYGYNCMMKSYEKNIIPGQAKSPGCPGRFEGRENH